MLVNLYSTFHFFKLHTTFPALLNCFQAEINDTINRSDWKTDREDVETARCKRFTFPLRFNSELFYMNTKKCEFEKKFEFIAVIKRPTLALFLEHDYFVIELSFQIMFIFRCLPFLWFAILLRFQKFGFSSKCFFCADTRNSTISSSGNSGDSICIFLI